MVTYGHRKCKHDTFGKLFTSISGFFGVIQDKKLRMDGKEEVERRSGRMSPRERKRWT